MGPAPAVAACRLGVRRALVHLDPHARVVVACSGGADSLALLSAAVFEARHNLTVVHGVTVDHGLQRDSAQRAAAVLEQMRDLGAATAEAVSVRVCGPGGPEAAARTARYDALRTAATERSAAAVLLGHTRDDQAETVLLGLARGSGARSLSGMAPVCGIYRRPLLGLSRTDTEAACAAEEIAFWDDPHNQDTSFSRVRVRHRILPVLETELGPGITEALARTAGQLREDADALDGFARRVLADATVADDDLDVEVLVRAPTAVRRRTLRMAALAAGCPATELFSVHVVALEKLITGWHGQRGVDLPGPVSAARLRTGRRGVLRFTAGPVAG